VGWVLVPGKWTMATATSLWDRYVHLVGVREANQSLRTRLDRAELELARLREDAREVRRLRRLLSFDPPPRWDAIGARVVAHRLGPHAALDTLVVDKGFHSQVGRNTPVITPEGVVGRIVRDGPHVSTTLLLTDLNSRIAVIGAEHRTTGMLSGKGPGQPLQVHYMPLNAPLEEGELLLTSGLADIFPKGLPAARVVGIERSDISLFQTVTAEPLVDIRNLEEVLLLVEEDAPPAAANATLPAANATRTAADG
jgi:rod shape-determining protein MreC